MIGHRRTWATAAAALLVASTATPATAQTPTAQLSASQQVRVALKTKWKVKRASQLRITGQTSCSVAKLIRKKKKPAKAVLLNCSVPATSGNGASLRITVTVKGRKGAKTSKQFTVTSNPSGPGGNPTPSPTQPSPKPTTPPPTNSRGPVTRVNADAAGNGGNSEAGSATWSPDGTKVAFYSKATNLVPGVSDGCAHVYLKTLGSGAIRVVDTALNGTLGDGCPSDPGINMGLGFSPQGDWLLFCSSSTNLGVDPSSGPDLFGKNLNSGDVEYFGFGCGWPTWSPDGTKIAFATEEEFIPACGYQNNGNWDVFWVDRNSTLQNCSDFHRVSSDSSGNQQTWSGPMDSERPVWSPDSKSILFESASPFLVANDTNLNVDLFVKNIVSNATTRVSTNSAGGQLSGYSERGAWSPDGGRIAFDSKANDVVPGDTNVHEDIFVKNLSSGAVTLVSTNAAGQPTLFPHRRPSWSPDGTSIAWESEAVDLVPTDANIRRDVFTKNLTTGFVQLVSSSANGVEGDAASNVFSSAPRIWSPDGTRVLFMSSAQNLAPGDNNAFNEDVYVKTL